MRTHRIFSYRALEKKKWIHWGIREQVGVLAGVWYLLVVPNSNARLILLNKTEEKHTFQNVLVGRALKSLLVFGNGITIIFACTKKVLMVASAGATATTTVDVTYHDCWRNAREGVCGGLIHWVHYYVVCDDCYVVCDDYFSWDYYQVIDGLGFVG